MSGDPANDRAAGAGRPVLVFSPMPLISGKGNAVSALRIARLLEEAGIEAMATDVADAGGAGVLVVLNSWRSAGLALNFKREHPDRPLVAVLTGTDIFPVFPAGPEVIRVLDAADAIVAWHEESAAQLPDRYRGKTRVIYKSAPDIPGDQPAVRPWPSPPDPIEVLVIGHLREVKDPFRAAEAARLLPDDSRIRIIHAGEALSDEMADRTRREMAENARYTWLGSISRGEVLDRLRSASLTVNSSFAEGGANAVIESLRCGVPVFASRIPGNTGLLGREWPGLFDAGDTAGLAALLRRFETDPEFHGRLALRTAEAAGRSVPAAERDGWSRLIRDLRK